MGSFNNKLVGDLKKLWQLSKKISLPKAPDSDEAWDLLSQRLDIEDRLEVSSSLPSKSKLVWSQPKPRLALAMALVVLAVVISPSLYRLIDQNTLMANRGQTIEETLPDGSIITLNAESQIAYGSAFGKGNRNITLMGEAYFDVEKNNVPFTIQAGEATVTVVGTEFNVRARNDQIEVAVNEGIVKVISEDSTITLTAGQMTSFFQGDFPNLFGSLPFQGYPGWVQNQLMFHKTELLFVCQEIGRRFDVKIELMDKNLEPITVTGVIDALDIKSVLSTLTFLTQRNYESKDGKIIIY